MTMLKLTELKRRVTGEVPQECSTLIDPVVIIKVESHEEHGIDGPCVKIYSDEIPAMVCHESVDDIEQQLKALDNHGGWEEAAGVLQQQLDVVAERLVAIESTLEQRAQSAQYAG